MAHRRPSRSSATGWATDERKHALRDTSLERLDQNPLPRYYLPYAPHNQFWHSWGAVVARVAPGSDVAAVQEGMPARDIRDVGMEVGIGNG